MQAMATLSALLVVALLLCSSGFGEGSKFGDCKITVSPTSRKQPLLIDLRKQRLYYPDYQDETSVVSIPSGTKYMVACPASGDGKRYALSYCECFDTQVSAVDEAGTNTCRSRNVSQTDNNNNNEEPMPDCEGGACKIPLQAVTESWEDEGCNAYAGYLIGWSIKSDLFIPIIHICFNEVKETTLYTKHKLVRSKGKERTKKDDFRDADKFTADIENVYRMANQMKLISKLQSPPELGKNDIYFSKGHLAPRADFYYAAEQKATFSYLNVVPQLQTLNSKNWGRLEVAIRNLAMVRPNLIVWTGTHGTLKLLGINNNDVPLFLDQETSRVPVPALMWKAVLDPDKNEALAIVMINSDQQNNQALALLPKDQEKNPKAVKWLQGNSNKKWDGIYCFPVGKLISSSVIPKIPELEEAQKDLMQA